MAKKTEKDAGGPREAVRGAVESTFQRVAGGASKAQELLDDIARTARSLVPVAKPSPDNETPTTARKP